jgi:DNA replication protein DnaC
VAEHSMLDLVPLAVSWRKVAYVDGYPQLHDNEWLYRETRKLARRLKLAKLKGRAAFIEVIDYTTARGLRKDQLLDLARTAGSTLSNRCSSLA